MASYEEKLTPFARGKRLLRLPRPIRNRADAFCDACGSTLPRTLFALKYIESGRYYFAGVNCLKELASQGTILRRFGRESGQAAYDAEMQIRNEKAQGEVILRNDTTRENNPAVVSEGENQPVVTSDHENFPPAVLMIQYPYHYSAVVAINGTEGKTRRHGYAKESRWEERLRRTGVGGLELEMVRYERPEAARMCITRAWQEARSSITDLNASIGDSGGNSIGLPDSLLALIELADLTKNGGYRVAADWNGGLVEIAQEIALWKP